MEMDYETVYDYADAGTGIAASSCKCESKPRQSATAKLGIFLHRCVGEKM